MEENLISKKELLALTGISYGALYRWKRKQLIPEDWFIKKSTFTGPETFFPREKILERIAKIQEMKEKLSLDDLAQTFSGAPLEIQTTPEELIREGFISKAVTGLSQFVPGQVLDFYGVLYLGICDRLLRDGTLNLSETGEILEQLLSDFKSFEPAPVLSVYRKMGVTFSILRDEKSGVKVDRGSNEIASLPTAEIWETIKTKWRIGQ
ncbi:YhbD family protein [Brucepastera parasyntrophica]|uniref:DUF4004 family protein n=1 Tax=Brucepastera parasyntrophica TaxID=2880008 RepID=UPI00210E13F1|nr:DUF4004 family protein [Brucepastera parasyntrophica]ULQ58502.1 YhbD family protein [Brucepastera parasyntrophica]